MVELYYIDGTPDGELVGTYFTEAEAELSAYKLASESGHGTDDESVDWICSNTCIEGA